MLRTLLEHTHPWLAHGVEAAQHYAKMRLPSTYLAREIAPEFAAAVSANDRAHLVIGPRQAGKSTLIWSFLADTPGHILYLNCEEPLIREWCRSPGLFSADLEEWLPPGGTLYLEEAQWLEDAGLFLKGLVDLRLQRRIIVSGSSSFHLMSRTRESLAGRATRHQIWPFSLREITHPQKTIAAAQRKQAREAMERQLLFGGYPAAWKAENPIPILQELVTAVVLRDASDRFRLDRPDAFRGLLQLAAGQIGDLVNYSEWGRILGIATSTVADYAALLEETHILRFVRPFAGGKRAELTQSPKVYYVDTGLRNAVRGGFSALDDRNDTGHLLENWVFGELHKRWPEPGQVRFWRTRGGAEIDFVLESASGHSIGIEVKSSQNAELSRSTRSFIDAYAPRHVLLVTRGERRREAVDDTIVDWVPAELLPHALDLVQ